ncbi:MAG: replication-relaxation family protein [Chloroflexota bacterium]|nr:replication-relaxation family protein [Chloroflexota bacterium]
MTGTERRGMVVQKRDRHLLEEIAVMRVIDREQARLVAGFGSTTRVNARLLKLTRAGLLRRFFLGTTSGGAKGLYCLSAKGAQLVESPLRGLQRRMDEMLVADFFVQHQLAVNDLYCTLKYKALPPGITFRRWIAFSEPLTPALRLIPDGYVELGTSSEPLATFFEVDLGTEALSVWKQKVRNYLTYAISGECERRFGQRRFRVAVVATTERRLHSLRAVIAQATEKIFWLTTLGAVADQGFFAPICFRPRDNEPQPFVRDTP